MSGTTPFWAAKLAWGKRTPSENGRATPISGNQRREHRYADIGSRLDFDPTPAAADRSSFSSRSGRYSLSPTASRGQVPCAPLTARGAGRCGKVLRLGNV